MGQVSRAGGKWRYAGAEGNKSRGMRNVAAADALAASLVVTLTQNISIEIFKLKHTLLVFNKRSRFTVSVPYLRSTLLILQTGLMLLQCHHKSHALKAKHGASRSWERFTESSESDRSGCRE